MTPPAIQFLGITKDAKIYVPKEAVKYYKKASGWNQYIKQIRRIQ
jgi:hypothetical protein